MTVVATVVVAPLPRPPVLTLMLACKPIVCFSMFVLKCSVQLSVPATSQPLIMRVGMHLVKLFVVVVMPIVQPLVASIMLAIIRITMAILRRCE